MGDASQTIEKRKNQTIYINQLNTFVAESSTNGLLSTCTTAPTSTITATFASFENKFAFFDGKNACEGCTCPVTGYAAR